eukprot:10389-Rhodomonas_salina.4
MCTGGDESRGVRAGEWRVPSSWISVVDNRLHDGDGGGRPIRFGAVRKYVSSKDAHALHS